MREKTNIKYAYFGGGCFWCVEATFKELKGVISVISGYSGGEKETANYKDVSSGKTKHAEICQIKYDPKIISFDTLLTVFFLSHDPTTLNRQGNDIGSQYRSIIFYLNDDESEKCIKHIKNLENNKIYENIVTEIKIFKKFYRAENYHKNYFESNPNQTYCSLIIAPKIKKLRKKLNKYY